MEFKIFDTLLEPVFILSADKKVIYCNEPAALICEMSVRKISRGQVFDEIIQFAEPLPFLQDLASLQDASPYLELSFKAASGKEGKAQITCQPIEHTTPSWILFFRDVTLEETLQKKYRAELEQVQHYSKNLERMVDERTAEIQKLNQTMSALLDSLHQGFFIFNKAGLCLDVSSKACDTTIEGRPSGQQIWNVLKLAQNEVTGFQKWMTALFAEMLPFEDIVALGPQTFPHSAGRHVQLQYYPLRNNDSALDAVVVVATDITNLIEAQNEAESERAYAKMILQLVKNKRQVASFLREARDLLSLLKKEVAQREQLNIEDTFRYLHTLKGGAASFSIKAMADVCHTAESLLSSFKWNGIKPQDLQQLSGLSLEIQEQFNRFQIENKEILGDESKLNERWIEAPVSEFYGFRDQHLGSLQSQFSAFTEAFVKEPIGLSFERYNEVLQSVAANENKLMAPLQLVGENLRILPEPYESLFSTMIHAFRNAVDHGIESPEIRTAAGKSPEGHVQVTFEKTLEHNKSFLKIMIKDDGGGVNPEKIRERLRGKGIETAHESNAQVIQHIFDSQFSTKEQITETSGRGVGMDAIAYSAIALGGKAWVESTLGQGTTLIVLVPDLEHSPMTIKKKAA